MFAASCAQLCRGNMLKHKFSAAMASPCPDATNKKGPCARGRRPGPRQGENRAEDLGARVKGEGDPDDGDGDGGNEGDGNPTNASGHMVA